MSKIALNKDYPNYRKLQALYATQLFPELIASLSEIDLGIMDKIFQIDQYRSTIYPSRSTIAASAGCCTKTVTRRSDFLHKKGLIIKTRKPGMPYDMCIYELTTAARQMKQRIKALYKMYKNAGRWVGLSVSLAMSAPTAVRAIGVPPVSYKDISYIKNGVEVVSFDGVAQPKRESTKQLTRAHERQAVNVPDHIQKLTPFLHLTAHGQIKLMAFDKEAIDHGIEQTKLMKSCTNIFKELVNVCMEYSSANNLAIDWKGYYEAIESGSVDRKTHYTKRVLTHPILYGKKQDSGNDKIEPKYRTDLMEIEHQKGREKQAAWEAQFTPEELAHKQRVVLASNPEWVETGRILGVDMTRYEVTEQSAVVVCPNIDKEDEIWDNIKSVPFVDEGSDWEEIF